MIESVSELPKGAGSEARASCMATFYRPARSLSALVTVHESMAHLAPDELVAHASAQRREFTSCEIYAQLTCPFNCGDQRQPSGRRARFHFQYLHRFSAFRYFRAGRQTAAPN